MKKLSIPYFSQKPKTSDCGPVCSLMLAHYFGETNIALEDIKKELHYDSIGTSIYENALFFLKNGYKATVITMQPLLFSPDTISAVQTAKPDTLIQFIKERKKKLHKSRHPVANQMITYIKSGGAITTEIPNFSHIKKAIDNSLPVMALVYGRALGSKEGGYHFVIVDGYKKDFLHITNPLHDSSVQAWFPVSDFLFALHAGTTTDIDNGSLLVLSRK